MLRGLHEDDPEGGYRVLADDLHDLGYKVSERRVWRLCRLAGIRSVITTRKRRYKKAGAPGNDDLVQRDFTSTGPNQWLTDITEHWAVGGKLYCCAVKDVWSNKIVGYAIDARMRARLAVNALEMAVAHRGNPAGVVVHSDRVEPAQYTSIVLTDHFALEEIAASMGSIGDAYDNALMETINGLYKAECVRTTIFHDGPYKTIADVEYATAGWVDWYNHRTLHGSLGMSSPDEYEAAYYEALTREVLPA